MKFLQKHHKVPCRNFRKPLSEKQDLTKQHLADYAETLAGAADAIWESQNSYEEDELMTSDNPEDSSTFAVPYPALTPAMQVNLQDKYLLAFDEFSWTQAAWLCGGAVLDLIRHQEESADLDFVLPSVNTEQLISMGYKKDWFKANSYFKQHPSLIDVRLIPDMKADSNQWMAKDVANRDFNICKLYCDSKGNIYDPEGKGLHDFRQGILSMGGNEAEKLTACPARIIRAMKYIQRGYKPDEALSAALESFSYLNPQKTRHLYAVTRKFLTHSNDFESLKFLGNLQYYGLMEVLFDLDDLCTVEELFKKVTYAEVSHFLFFSPSRESTVKTGRLEVYQSNQSLFIDAR